MWRGSSEFLFFQALTLRKCSTRAPNIIGAVIHLSFRKTVTCQINTVPRFTAHVAQFHRSNPLIEDSIPTVNSSVRQQTLDLLFTMRSKVTNKILLKGKPLLSRERKRVSVCIPVCV